MRAFTSTGVPAKPCTVLSSSAPRKNGSTARPADSLTTETPAFAAGLRAGRASRRSRRRSRPRRRVGCVPERRGREAVRARRCSCRLRVSPLTRGFSGSTGAARERRPVDEEQVRDAPRLVPLPEDDEAVVLAGAASAEMRARRRHVDARRPARRRPRPARRARRRRSRPARRASPSTAPRRRPRRRSARAAPCVAAPCVTVEVLERERRRVGEEERLLAPGSETSPPPSSGTGASCVRAVSAQAGPAVATSADFTSPASSRGGARAGARRRRRRAASPSRCRRRRRSATCSCSAASRRGPGRRARRRRASGRGRTASGPRDEKLVTMPLRPVFELLRSCCRRGSSSGRRASSERAQAVAVEVGDHPGRQRERDRDRRSPRPARLSARMIPSLRRALAWAAFVTNGQRPRWRARSSRRASAPAASPSSMRGRRRLPAEVALDRLAVGADDRADVDERLVGPPTAAARSSRRRPGTGCPSGRPARRRRRRRAPGRRRASSRRRRRRSRRAPSRASRPSRCRSRRGRCRRRSPARRRPRRRCGSRSTIASFAGSVCGPPPEKLITSIPSATAASNAAMISGVFATWPIGVGTVKTR